MRTIDIHWNDVKDAFENFVGKGEQVPFGWGETSHTRRLKELATDPYAKDDFAGGSGSETLQWVRKGFHSPVFKRAGNFVKAAPKKKRTYNDSDGMPDLDRLYSGETNFFVKREKRDAKPGMTINVQYAFAAMVNAKEIETYGAWIAGFIGALEAQGYDLEVFIESTLQDLMKGDRNMPTTMRAKVKGMGEKSRFHSWSCLFSPTGYRHLIFTAYYVAGEKIGKRPNSCLGMTLGGTGWGVDYNRKANVVTIKCDQRARACNLDRLNRDAQVAGLL